jgi:glycolate oxidase FAD binding subunit
MTIHAPADSSEVARIVAASAVQHRPVSVRAGASKASWYAPQTEAAVLDLSKLRGIVDYQPTELVLTARAATPLQEIEAALQAHEQMLAFEPPDWRALLGTTEREQTLGGIIACNLSGPRRVTAGAARDHFLGVEAVSGHADIFKAGGKVVKNVTGYDLCKVLAGSHGTLAVMTEITLKVMPRPEASVSVVRFGLSDALASRLMIDALNSGHEISAAAHLPAEIAPRGMAVTAVRVEGSKASVKARRDALRDEFSADVLDEQESIALWASVRDLTPLVGIDAPVWRLSVPPARATRILAAIRESISCRWLYDWGGALIWLCADPGVRDGGAEVVRAALAEDGHAFLVRASADLRARVETFQPLTPLLDDLTARVKRAFDPKGILSPGCLAPRA